MEPVITEKNNENSGFEVIKNDAIFGHLLNKVYFFLLTLVSFSEQFGDFYNLKALNCNMQMSIYFYTLFILITYENEKLEYLM